MSGLILAYTLCNGLVSFLTSLPSRRADKLNGEHLHKLFKLGVNKLDSMSSANQALLKLNRDNERKTLLERLQVLFIEEISLISAETWNTVDIILRRLKGRNEMFGGVAVIANGDCCQLPNITGYNIFEACSFLFTSNFHFLNNFVRMVDPAGQELLRLIERRPLQESEIERCVEIIGENCCFVSTWNDIEEPMIMKVFGKRIAEKESFESHCQNIYNSGVPYKKIISVDEISPKNSHLWKRASHQVSTTENLANQS